ncbi:hypothetical protein [Micromonospora sp. WMMD812]|uniref:hypothetical protein n=1 Tax=Micromonospora sp. WMMD812 TaxID=3015152 RepID=UPI00248B77FE|nr:hypothetical protein [Micromonospora sp. WMMD812]WBB67747.1 hypothetical protein O7603_32705 [Micromonospora sp. WMMD812]
MNIGRMGDIVVGAAGNAAGAVVDPRGGLTQLRSALTGRLLASVAVGLVIGYVVARSARRN